MAVGTTANATITRDRLIELSHEVIGVLPQGETLDGDQLQDGIDLLNMIVRETDVSGKWLWTIEAASHLTLAASTHRYDSSNGLPTNIAELLTAHYRDSNGTDTPLDVLKNEQYEAISEKMRIDVPQSVYLTEHRDLSSRVLYVHPMLSSVSTQSVVTGSDANTYKCIYPHTAAAVTYPITGANWRMAWQLGGSGPATWASGTKYTCTQQIRLTYRRPLYDFDTASDTPDFPSEWPRALLYKLAFDLGDLYSIPIEERRVMIEKAKGAVNDIFPNIRAKSKKIHHKVKYF